MTTATRTTRAWRGLVFLGVLWVAAAAAAADYRDFYKQGTQAVEEGRWTEAILSLQAAIAERADERIGFRRYLPHYYLGVALSEQGDCRGAVVAFTESERQGQINKGREYADLQRRMGLCQQQIDSIDAVRVQTDAELARARKEVDGLVALSREARLAATWAEGSNSFAARQQEARRTLERAEKAFAEGVERDDTDLMEQARRLALTAVDICEDVRIDARERVAAVQEATASARERLVEVEGSLSRVLRSIVDLAPYPPRLEERVAEAEAALAEVAAAGEEASTASLDQLTDRLTVTLSRLRRAARRPPSSLAQAAEAYLNGEYEMALEYLSEQGFEDQRARAHACMLRAASRHALFLLEGQNRHELLEQASADIAECSQLAQPPEPHPRYYSPRFLEFFLATLEAQTAAEEATDEEASQAATEAAAGQQGG